VDAWLPPGAYAAPIRRSSSPAAWAPTDVSTAWNGTPHRGKQRLRLPAPQISNAQTWSGGHSSPFGQFWKSLHKSDVQLMAWFAQAGPQPAVIRQAQQAGSAPHGGRAGAASAVQVHAPPAQTSPGGHTPPAQTSPDGHATQRPSAQSRCGEAPAAAQSAPVRHRHVRRPVRSFGPQTPEQQLAFSRQRDPGVRQATASARSAPTRPKAPAARPAMSRRREPAIESNLVKASKREPSKAMPPDRFRANGLPAR
jgi:hypothetical protein